MSLLCTSALVQSQPPQQPQSVADLFQALHIRRGGLRCIDSHFLCPQAPLTRSAAIEDFSRLCNRVVFVPTRPGQHYYIGSATDSGDHPSRSPRPYYSHHENPAIIDPLDSSSTTPLSKGTPAITPITTTYPNRRRRNFRG
jgi:hypothetical protein